MPEDVSSLTQSGFGQSSRTFHNFLGIQKKMGWAKYLSTFGTDVGLDGAGGGYHHNLSTLSDKKHKLPFALKVKKALETQRWSTTDSVFFHPAGKHSSEGSRPEDASGIDLLGAEIVVYIF